MKKFNELNATQQCIITGLNNLTFDKHKRLDSVAINQLRIVFEEHCIAEEAAMKEVDYPFTCAHILAHSIASKYFMRISDPDSRYLISDLIAEIMLHINTYDQQFSDYLKENHK